MTKQKLELTWIGENNPEYDIANIEPRILEERKDLSYGDPKTENILSDVSQNHIFAWHSNPHLLRYLRNFFWL